MRLEYDLACQHDGWASESGQYQRARGTGGRQQKFLDDEPPYARGDDFYMRAFWQLSTERQFGQVIGPIPWSKIISYGERESLDYYMCSVFVHVVRELDECYLKWTRDKQERQVEQTRPKK